MCFENIDIDALENEYVKDEMKKWHYILEYPFAGSRTHTLLPVEESNTLTARFRPTQSLIGCLDNTSGKEMTDVRPDQCRFFQVGETIYDMYDPESIIRIPIPEVIGFRFTGVPEWYIEKYRQMHRIPETCEENISLLSRKEIDILIDRAKKLYNGNLSLQEINELRGFFIVETEKPENISDREIVFWTDLVVMSPEDFTKKYPMNNEPVGKKTQPDLLKVINNNTSTDLYSAVLRKGTSEFQVELVAPLAYIAVNLYICSHEMLPAPERLIAQLYAVGADEYARFLDRKLSRMVPLWNFENTIEYGTSLKTWARNNYEYYWLKNHFPYLVPKSNGAYTAAKNKKSKRFLQLKAGAETLGFSLSN